MKNSKTKWIDLKEVTESKEVKLSFKLDKVKGMVTYDSLKNSIYPKTRMALPYVYTDYDSKNKICK